MLTNFSIELGDSRPVGALANPSAPGKATPAGFEARFPAREKNTAMWLLLLIDLQTNATTPAPAAGPCAPATLVHEVQRWNVTMDYVDAAGVRRIHPVQGMDVDVYRSAA